MIATDTNIPVSVRENSSWQQAALAGRQAADRDYSRFAGLPARNPLLTPGAD